MTQALIALLVARAGGEWMDYSTAVGEAGGRDADVVSGPSGWGGTLDTLYAWKLKDGPLFAAIPSLSRYAPSGRESFLERFFEELRAHW